MSAANLISSVFVEKDTSNHLQNGLSVLGKMNPGWISGFFADVSIMTTSRTNLRSSGLTNFTQGSMVLFRLSTTDGHTLRRLERRLLEEHASLSGLESIIHAQFTTMHVKCVTSFLPLQEGSLESISSVQSHALTLTASPSKWILLITIRSRTCMSLVSLR